jgi:hypothetical protein
LSDFPKTTIWGRAAHLVLLFPDGGDASMAWPGSDAQPLAHSADGRKARCTLAIGNEVARIDLGGAVRRARHLRTRQTGMASRSEQFGTMHGLLRCISLMVGETENGMTSGVPWTLKNCAILP